MTFGDVPDVTVVTAPTKQLQAVVDSCIQELDNFSRVVGRNPDARNKLEGLLQLPATLWPAEMRKKLLELVGRLESGMLALRLGELLSALGGTAGPFTPDKVRGLARSLELSGIGFEPDVLNGARAPAIADSIVLFALPLSDGALTNDRAFQTAALTVQLAAGVAHADGDFSAAEVDHLRREIQSWTHLTYRCQQRLLAHLQWLTKAPIALASLKKKLESLDQLSKEGIATFMASVVQADGVVSPAEIKFLEKVYKALGVDVKRVFSDVHAATTGAPPTKSENTGFKLDTRRVNELQQDTERVSALLANIFKDDTVPIDPPIQEVAGDSEPVTQLLGLDETHAALARLMLSRPQWSREELEDAAADLQLMLDGALELINEASFDTYDLPFAEGSDPVEVNGEVLEKIAA